MSTTIAHAPAFSTSKPHCIAVSYRETAPDARLAAVAVEMPSCVVRGAVSEEERVRQQQRMPILCWRKGIARPVRASMKSYCSLRALWREEVYVMNPNM